MKLPTTVQTKNNKSTIDDQSVLLSVDFELMGNTRKIKNVGDKGSGAAIETNAKKEMVSFSKKLLESAEFDAIKSHDSETKGWIRARSLPSMFKSSIYRVPAELVTVMDDYLTIRQHERRELIEEFGQTYHERVEASVESLEKAGCLTDYKSREEAMRDFALQWYFVAVSVPMALKKVSAELFRQEEAKLKTHTADAAQAMTDLLRQEMAKLVGHMVDRMTDDGEGQRKTFKESSIERTKEAFELLEARNLTGDEDLMKLTQRARNLMEGVDAEVLRDDNQLRAMLANGFGEIQSAMSAMMVDQGPRRYREED